MTINHFDSKDSREARQAAQTTQQILFSVEKLLSDTSINIAQLEKERIASLGTAIANQAQLMVAQAQAENYNAAQIIEVLKILEDRMNTLILGGDPETAKEVQAEFNTLKNVITGTDLTPTK